MATSIKTKKTTMKNMIDRVLRLNLVLAADPVFNIINNDIEYKRSTSLSKLT